MFDHHIRGLKDQILMFLARPLRGVNPSTVTVIAFVVGLVGVWFITQQQTGWGLFFWLLNRVLDGLDGTLARMHDRQTDFGGYLDIVLDFGIYALFPVALVIGYPSEKNYIALAFLLGNFYVNSASWMYLAGILEKRRQGAQAQGELTTISMPPGLIGGTETVIIFSAFMIWPQVLAYLFVGMGVLILMTIGQRLVWAARHLEE